MVWPYYTVEDCNLRWTEDYPATAEWRYSWLCANLQNTATTGKCFFPKDPTKQRESTRTCYAPPADSSIALITSEGQTLLAKLSPKYLTAETCRNNSHNKWYSACFMHVNWFSELIIFDSALNNQCIVCTSYIICIIIIYTYIYNYIYIIHLWVYVYILTRDKESLVHTYHTEWNDQTKAVTDLTNIQYCTSFANSEQRSLRCQHQCWSPNKAPALHSV